MLSNAPAPLAMLGMHLHDAMLHDIGLGCGIQVLLQLDHHHHHQEKNRSISRTLHLADSRLRFHVLRGQESTYCQRNYKHFLVWLAWW